MSVWVDVGRYIEWVDLLDSLLFVVDIIWI